jgi:hypothetical protein
LLFTDSVTCSNGDGEVTLPLPASMKPQQLSILRGLPDSDLFFIVTTEGEHYRLPTELPIKQWTAQDLEITPSLAHFRSVGLMPGLQRFGITMDGTFVHYEDISELQPVAELQTMRFKKIIAPFLWSQKLLEL